MTAVAHRWLVAACLLLGLGGCGSGPPTISTERIMLKAAPDMNEDQAMAVDLVYVSDKDLADRLATVAARDWFAGKAQFQLDFPKGMVIHSWELPPNCAPVIDPVEGALDSSIAAFLFANYASPGNHRARLDLLAKPVVKLQMLDFHVEEASDD